MPRRGRLERGQRGEGREEPREARGALGVAERGLGREQGDDAALVVFFVVSAALFLVPPRNQQRRAQRPELERVPERRAGPVEGDRGDEERR